MNSPRTSYASAWEGTRPPQQFFRIPRPRSHEAVDGSVGPADKGSGVSRGPRSGRDAMLSCIEPFENRSRTTRPCSAAAGRHAVEETTTATVGWALRRMLVALVLGLLGSCDAVPLQPHRSREQRTGDDEGNEHLEHFTPLVDCRAADVDRLGAVRGSRTECGLAPASRARRNNRRHCSTGC